MVTETMPAEVKKAIKGLMFQTNQELEEKGSKRKRSVPYERPMTEEDVLSWALNGPVVTIVSKDGRKHRIDPAQEKGEKK